MKQKVFRPTLDDVERISLGKGSRKRGTGSRYVCHRLNQEERQLYNQAKINNYLVVKGTAYRRRRKGSPVCNTFRQRCDALDQVCVVVEKYAGGDRIKIDFSTLRVRDDTAHILQVWNMLNEKYSEVMDNATNHCRDARIDWNLLKNKAIWNIEPRLLVIESIDRAVAKSIADDVMTERFTCIDVDDNLQNNGSGCDTNAQDILLADTEDADKDDATDGIDWNDI